MGEPQWKVVNTPNPVKPDPGFLLSSISCQGETCIAVSRKNGGYQVTDKGALIYVSHDKGHTWAISPNPDFLPTGTSFTSVQCVSSQVCLITGVRPFSPEIKPETLPIILKTSDAGNTWTSIQKIPAPGILSNILTGLVCTDKVCIASGAYQGENLEKDMSHYYILVSQDQGQTWILAPNPEPVNNYPFYSVLSVSGVPGTSKLVAIGTMSTGGPQNTSELVALSSQDYGLNWSQTTINLPNPAPAATTKLIDSVSCTANYCVAAGYYYDSTQIKYTPILIRQNIGDANWQTINVSSVLSGRLDGVSCHDNECILGNGDGNIGISTNEGLGWSVEPVYFTTQPHAYGFRGTTLAE